MSPRYTLKYFNVTGLAEPIRYLFAYGNIEYEDQRFEYEEWKNYKGSTPFGQVPVLEVDGKAVNQSIAICRYLAKQLNLVGKNEWEALEIDMIVDTIADFRHNYSGYFREQNEEVKAKKLDDIKKIHNPYYLTKFQEIVRKNGGYFVGGQLTWADIYFASLAELWSNVVKEQILTDYPELNALKQKVDNLPGIKEYRERRPKTVDVGSNSITKSEGPKAVVVGFEKKGRTDKKGKNFHSESFAFEHLAFRDLECDRQPRKSFARNCLGVYLGRDGGTIPFFPRDDDHDNDSLISDTEDY